MREGAPTVRSQVLHPALAKGAHERKVIILQGFPASTTHPKNPVFTRNGTLFARGLRSIQILPSNLYIISTQSRRQGHVLDRSEGGGKSCCESRHIPRIREGDDSGDGLLRKRVRRFRYPGGIKLHTRQGRPRPPRRPSFSGRTFSTGEGRPTASCCRGR
jgi:hypothetical protein